jgi:hypothetical protein
MRMNGLRIFINSDEGLSGDNVFYSQRSSGPVYRWHYETQLSLWQVSRVDNRSGSHELRAIKLRSLPKQLKTRLSEHYLE